MRAETDQNKILEMFKSYQVQVYYDETRFRKSQSLTIILTDIFLHKKFKAQYNDLPDHLIQNFDSLKSLFEYMKLILETLKNQNLLKIDQNGLITIFRVEKQGKINQWVLTTTQQKDRRRGFQETFRQSRSFHYPFQNQPNDSKNQNKNLEKRISNIQKSYQQIRKNISQIKKPQINIPNSFQQARRSNYMKDGFGEVKLFRQAYINGYFCDFYLRENNILQIFLLKTDDGDQYYILQEESPFKRVTPNDLYNQIGYFIDNDTASVNIKILKNGVLSVKFRREISGVWGYQNQTFQGQKIECNYIQKLQKLIELNKKNTSLEIAKALKSQTDILLEFERHKYFIQIKIEKIISPNLFILEAKISSILLTKESCQTLFNFFPRQTVKHIRLLFKASQNSYSAQRFHEACNYMTNTITLVKTQNHIFGGYAVAGWNRNGAYTPDNTRGSFIFSLTNNDKFVLQEGHINNSINNTFTYGPTFGGGHDLYISNKCNSNTNSYANICHSYRCQKYINGNAQSQRLFSGSRNFRVIQYEVYEVCFV